MNDPHANPVRGSDTRRYSTGCAAGEGGSQATSGALMLRNCCLPGRPSDERVDLTILDDRITSISKSMLTERCQSPRLVDVGGRFVAPGLIDMHVHVTLRPSGEAWRTRGELLENGVANCKRALDAGITTLRDLGSAGGAAAALRDLIQQGAVDGPRLMVSGHMLTSVRGHGTEAELRFGVELESAPDARLAVASEVAQGADLIKVATQGGPNPLEIDPETLDACVDEAHKRGLRVACHAHFREESIALAVNARVDTLEHGCRLTRDLSRRMADQGTAYCPTLDVVARIAEDPKACGVDSPSFIEKVRDAVRRHVESVQLARDAEVLIVAGTDAGVAGIAFDGIHSEMRRLEEAGLPRNEVLAAATTNAAKVLGYANELGELRVGAKADLILTDEDPLKNLGTLRFPRVVFSSGKVVRGQLSS